MCSVGCQVRSSGLAVAAADRDGLGAFDDLGEGLGACDHTHAHRACRLELGRILDGAAVDEQVLTEHVLRVVTDLDRDPGVLELGGGVGGLRVAAADLVAAREIYARQRGNAGAADAHEVNPHRCTTSRTTSSTRCAASRRPAPEEAGAVGRSGGGGGLSGVDRRVWGVSSSSASRPAAPALTIAAALSSWWPPPNVPGTSTIGKPTAVASAMVPTPARPTIRSARDVSPGMSSEKAIPS